MIEADYLDWDESRNDDDNSKNRNYFRLKNRGIEYVYGSPIGYFHYTVNNFSNIEGIHDRGIGREMSAIEFYIYVQTHHPEKLKSRSRNIIMLKKALREKGVLLPISVKKRYSVK